MVLSTFEDPDHAKRRGSGSAQHPRSYIPAPFLPKDPINQIASDLQQAKIFGGAKPIDRKDSVEKPAE
jgi:hypothetical protein